MKIYILLCAVVAIVSAQKPKYEYATPVPILKQIDKHNEDGSYSYGYENADGTYKIETKYQTGEVFGKYGYIDDVGKLREVEYGASRRGFEPAGTDVTVAPPTLTQNPDATRPLGPDEEDDGQYREDPAIYYKNDPNNEPDTPAFNAVSKTYDYGFNQNTYAHPAPQPTYQPSFTPPYNPPPQPTYTPTPQYNDYYNNRVNNPVPQYNSYAPQRPYWNPAPPTYPNYNQFQGHPAQNVDIWTGSYTVNYRR